MKFFVMRSLLVRVKSSSLHVLNMDVMTTRVTGMVQVQSIMKTQFVHQTKNQFLIQTQWILLPVLKAQALEKRLYSKLRSGGVLKWMISIRRPTSGAW